MPYVLALLSSAIYGVADFLGGVATRRAPLLAVTLASQAVGLAGLAVLVPVLSRSAPAAADLAWGAGAGLGGGVGIALLYRGLAIGPASVVAPVTAVLAIAVPVAADLLDGAALAGRVVAGIVVAMAAVALLSQTRSDATSAAPGGGAARPPRLGLLLALGAGAAIGAFLTCLGRTDERSGMWPLLAARIVSVSLFVIACLAARQPFVPGPGARAVTAGAGVLDVVANACYVVAVQQGALGPIATLASLYPASTVALASLVWRERLRAVQWAGVVLAFLAIVLITSVRG